jgi:hypothetical protein
METKAYGIQSPESLAKEYGGNKQKIAKAVQLGILDPTAAVLAGMFIDRVRNAAQEEQGPQTTVAQQVLGGPPPAPPQGPPPGPPQAGLQAAAPPPTRLAYGGQVGVSNNQVPEPAMERGLAGIPVPDNMFDYAGGGMVAFAGGGDVQRFQSAGAVRVNPTFPSSGLSYGYGMNPTGLDAVRMPFTGDYRIPGAVSSPAGTPSILQDPLSRVNPTGYKQFAEQVKKLEPYIDEAKLAQLYKDTAGSVAKAVNILKGVAPALGIGAASMAVEQATGLTPGEQLGRGVLAANPVIGSVLQRLGVLESSPLPTGVVPFTEKQIKEAQKNAGNLFGDRSELRAPPGRGVAGGTSTQLVDALGRPVDQAGNLISPEAAVNTAKRDEEIRRGNDVAAQATRQMMAPITIGKGEKPELLDVPKRADLETEAKKFEKLSKDIYKDPDDARKSLDDILKSDKETLTKQGYDFNLIKNMVAETRAEREKIPEQKKEAASLRLLEAGLAIMGGTSPYAFVNIGKGASEAAKGFNEDMKEFRKLDREYRKELNQLQSMQNQETLMLTTEGRKRYDRIQDKVRDAETKRAEFAFGMAKHVVTTVSKEREVAQTLNNALTRTFISEEGQDRRTLATIQGQQNVAGMSARLAQDEKDRYIRSWLERPENKNKDYAAAVEAFNASRLGLGVRGQLSYDEAIKRATDWFTSSQGMQQVLKMKKDAEQKNQRVLTDDEIIKGYANRLMQPLGTSSTSSNLSAADSIVGLGR